MTTLRIYDSASGDCLALRDDDSTLLIYDTGLKASYKRGQGFRRALDDSGLDPVTVAISHIDGDHVGGLIAWVEDIFRSSPSLRDARHRAQSQILEVWCNVPPEDRAFLTSVGADLSARDGDDERVSSLPRDGETEFLWKYLLADNLIERWEGDIEKLPGLARSQRVIRRRFGVDPGPPYQDDDQSRNRRRSDSHLSRAEWGPDRDHELAEAFATTRAWIRETFAGEEEIDFLDDLDSDRGRMHFHGPMDLDVSWAESPPWGQVLISYRGKVHGAPFIEIGLWMHNAHTNIEITMDHYGGTNSSLDELRGLLDGADNIQQFLSNLLQEADVPGLSRHERIRLTCVKALLGLLPVQETLDRLNVFGALRLLGIPLSGYDYSLYAGSPQSLKPARTNCTIVGPTKADVDALADRWHEFGRRLGVRAPSVALMDCMAMSRMTTWQADTSVKNLSSLALGFPDTGSGSALLLTGDSLNAQVLDTARLLRIFSGKSLIYQVPHHGSNHNTDCQHGPHPDGHFNASCPIAFISGGLDPNKKSLSDRPAADVLHFFGGGNSTTVIHAREKMIASALHHFDIALG